MRRAHNRAALPEAQPGLAAYGPDGDRRGRAMVAGLLGLLAEQAGDWDGAARLLEKALGSFTALGDTANQVQRQSLLGWLALKAGRVGHAEWWYGARLRGYAQAGASGGVGFSLAGLAACAVERDHRERAGRLFGASTAVLEQVQVGGGPEYEAWLHHYQDWVKAQLGPAGGATAHDLGQPTPLPDMVAAALAGRSPEEPRPQATDPL